MGRVTLAPVWDTVWNDCHSLRLQFRPSGRGALRCKYREIGFSVRYVVKQFKDWWKRRIDLGQTGRVEVEYRVSKHPSRSDEQYDVPNHRDNFRSRWRIVQNFRVALPTPYNNFGQCSQQHQQLPQVEDANLINGP